MEYQNGQPVLARAPARAHAPHLKRISRPEGTVPILHATHMVYRYEAPVKEAPDISDIRTACLEERAFDTRYRDADGSLAERRVYPLAIVYLDSSTGLLAWCCLRKDFRKSRMSRMETVKLTDQSFRPDRVRLLREHISQMSAKQISTSKVESL